ncbi:MAG: hypothetical protein Q7N95_14115 [Alphaproteobacteria bacterium]|nr:hypothetical protein [Alphaproteobacteria bacterium]
MEELTKIICQISIPDGIAGVIVGFVLSLLPLFLERRRQRKGCKASLKAEIKHCGKAACDYLGDGVSAPLYRLPIVAWENAYPVLLAAGVFAEGQVESLLKFYNAVETFNRGLDQIDAAIGDDKKIPKENDMLQLKNRLQLKAKAISSCSDYYSAAINALDKL